MLKCLRKERKEASSMTFREVLHHPKRYTVSFGKWTVLAILIGISGGLLGAGFHHVLHFVTHLRAEHSWLIFFLPVGGLLTIGLYRILWLRSNRGTNEIIEATLEGGHISPLVAPGIFLSTALTHLFGGSAGREGAALQLGGSVASILGRLFRLKRDDRKILIMGGMSAVFAGLFGTPLTACLFTMEFASVGTIFSPALLPCFLSALVASQLSSTLGVHAEVFPLNTAVTLGFGNIWKFLVLAISVSMLGVFMCWLFHKTEHLSHKWLPNTWLRILVGGLLVVGMTLLVGDHRYNGAGMDMALKAVSGEANWYDFALKMFFTAVTLAAGFKGGEIVPTFCVGATFGCLIGTLLGLDPGVAAALGLVGLFCCATNSALASIVLSIEMFGGANLYLFSLVCVICFVLSGHSGLYASQIIQFSKAAEMDEWLEAKIAPEQ